MKTCYQSENRETVINTEVFTLKRAIFRKIKKHTDCELMSGQMPFMLCCSNSELMVQTGTHNTVYCGADTYLEVIWKEQFAGPEETENVAEYLAIPIYEVVLLQAVQHDGLGAIEQTTDSGN